jgi:glycosyltransferase involved in cell wall biosynthesis
LKSDHPNFELLVIDQSTDDSSERALREFQSDPRLRHIRMNEVGVCRARNLAVESAKSEIVVFTDDDCEPSTGWLAAMEQSFDLSDQIGLAFCRVNAPEYDRSAGYVPVCDDSHTRTLTSLWQFDGFRGIGAGMAITKSWHAKIGGFDELLGPGGKFYYTGDDYGLAFRTLALGGHVRYLADVAVLHHGFRSAEEFSTMTRRTFFGIGAAQSTFLRFRPVVGLWMMAHDLYVHVLSPIAWHAVRFKRPPVLGRITGWLSGFRNGMATPINRLCLFDVQPKLAHVVPGAPTQKPRAASQRAIERTASEIAEPEVCRR